MKKCKPLSYDRPARDTEGMNQALRCKIALVFTVLALAGCKSRASDSASAPAPVSEAAPAAAATVAQAAGTPGSVGIPAAKSRALVVTMEMAVIVPDIDLAVGKIRGAVERAGGYVGDAKASGSESDRRAHMTLRIPTSQASDLRGTIGALGQVSMDNESAVDVTEEHADLEARLGNARAQEKRLGEIMKNNSGTISDVMYAENEIAKVREIIERMEAQKTTLDRKIDMATLNLDLTVPRPAYVAPPSAPDAPVASIVSAAMAGVHGAYVLFVYLAMALAASLPFLLPLAALIYGIVRSMRRRRNQRSLALQG